MSGQASHPGGSPAPAPGRAERRFGLDVMTLAGGAAVAEGIGLLLSPVLTRFFDPGAFGVLAVFTSMLSIGLLLVCPGYHFALVLPERDRDAAALLKGVHLVLAAVSVAVGLAVVFAADPLCAWLKEPQLDAYLWLLGPALWVHGLSTVLRYWNMRRSRFATMSAMTMTGALTRTGGRLAACLPGWVGAGTLVVTKVLGETVAAFGMAWITWRRDRHRFGATWREVWALLHRYRKFPLVNLGSNLLGTLSYQAPMVLLSSLFSATVVGYYSFGLHLVGLPTLIVGTAVGQAFFPSATAARREGRLPAVFADVFRNLLRLGCFPFLMLGLVGRDAFAVVFGPAWAESGVYVQLLVAQCLVTFVSQPVATLFSVMERQEAQVAFSLVGFVLRVAAILVGGWLGDPRLAVGLQAAVGSLVGVAAVVWMARECGVRGSWLGRELLRGVLVGSPWLLAAALARWVWHVPAPAVLLTALLGTACHYALLLWRNPELLRAVGLKPRMDSAGPGGPAELT